MRSTHPIARGGLALLALACLSACQPTRLGHKAESPEAAAEQSPMPPQLTGGKPLLMHYMPWYKTPDKRGEWGSHWTGHERQHKPGEIGENGLPDIWSHYHPLIGLYDSTDSDVLMCQLLQMKLAGVDGVIADWYGISNAADYAEIHAGTTALVEAVKRSGMYFSACYEDRSVQLLVQWNQLAPQETTNHLAGVFAWMQDQWFNDPNYFRLGDRPLLLNFGPIYFADPAAWATAMAPLDPKPALFSLHHLWRKTGAEGGYSWIHYEPWEGTPDDAQIRRRIHEVFTYFSSDPAKAIVSAYPGFNDVYTHENHRELAHRDGATLRETLDVALSGPWPVVQLVTWNDYGEGTMIEPTHEFGYTFLEVVQESRRKELGNAFAYTAEDLRLPAEILALARSGKHPQSHIDHLWYLLANGLTQVVRSQLQQPAD